MQCLKTVLGQNFDTEQICNDEYSLIKINPCRNVIKTDFHDDDLPKEKTDSSCNNTFDSVFIRMKTIILRRF